MPRRGAERRWMRCRPPPAWMCFCRSACCRSSAAGLPGTHRGAACPWFCTGLRSYCSACTFPCCRWRRCTSPCCTCSPWLSATTPCTARPAAAAPPAAAPTPTLAP
ncbi:hypothetical protein B484DRAFT_442552 [Ochromonadaceae sp. CCMP2298]|nr:hypothetical protein B484DRAFT_442552 [Ochromonadaceae sp. CCMP2298]